jgi:dCMP deaminase
MNEKWDLRFLKIAKEVSSWSKDESTKVGCVIVDEYKIIRSVGYNGLPRGLDDNIPERQERPLKYNYFNHAEDNALNNCNIVGVSTLNCTIYVTMCPCSACARNIIQSGIKRVAFIEPNHEMVFRWGEDFKVSLNMFEECRIDWKTYRSSDL